MKIPKSIKIGGHVVKVLYPYNFTERNDIDAQCDHCLNEIRISGYDISGLRMAESVLMVNFIHEVLHRIDVISGHKVFFKNEPAIEGISEIIYQVLVDNGYLKE